MFKEVEGSSKLRSSFSGVKSFWAIFDNQTVLDVNYNLNS